MESLIIPLINENLTTLKIRYDFKNDIVRLYAAKEWDKDLDFSFYNKDFYLGNILTCNARYLNTAEVRELYEKHGLSDYLNKIINLMREGKHFGLDCLFHEGFNIRFFCGIHNSKRGINNKSHAIHAGATRRHPLEDEELSVIIDALNLSRAMSFKNVAADIPFGGCKSAVHMDPLDIDNMGIMGFLSYCADSTRCLTGPDMNLPKEMVSVLNKNFTMQYCGGPGSPLGDTAIPTAYGAYLALKQAVKFKEGTDSLDKKTIAVQGLGSVGFNMAKYLLKEDVRLFVSDVNVLRVEKLISEYSDRTIIPIPSDEILYVNADILCPCAMGGIIDEDIISKLNFKYVFGPANNQLKATNQEEEIRLAKILEERGILFQTEWWHNCAGVLAAALEYIHGKDITYDILEKQVENTLPRKTWENLNKAKEIGITPTECAYVSCQNLIYS